MANASRPAILVPFADDSYAPCVYGTAFTLLSSGCLGRYYWVDFVAASLTILFPHNPIRFVPVEVFGPASRNESRQINSEVGYAYNVPGAVVTPTYLPLVQDFFSWMPGLRFVGPLMSSPVTLVYRRDLLSQQKSINAVELLKLAMLFAMFLASSAAARAAGMGRRPLAGKKAGFLVGGVLAAVCLSLMEGFMVLFFTNSMVVRLPIQNQADLVEAMLSKGVRMVTYSGGFSYIVGDMAMDPDQRRRLPSDAMSLRSYAGITEAVEDKSHKLIGVVGGFENITFEAPYFTNQICGAVTIALTELPKTLVGGFTRKPEDDFPKLDQAKVIVFRQIFERILSHYEKTDCRNDGAPKTSLTLQEIQVLFWLFCVLLAINCAIAAVEIAVPKLLYCIKHWKLSYYAFDFSEVNV